MNRRILLMTLGALSIVPTLALGKGTRPTDENIRALLAAGEEETAAVLEEPFVREVAAGTLSKDAFAWYFAQNLHYLDDYALSFDRFGDRLEGDDRALCRRWAEETRAMKPWTEGLFTKIVGGKPEESPFYVLRPTTAAYMRHERESAEHAPLLAGFAALLPCFTVYERMGTTIASTRKLVGNPYAEWLSAYGDPAYSETVDLAVNLAARLGSEASPEEWKRARTAYRTSCGFERRLFEAAYLLEEPDLR